MTKLDEAQQILSALGMPAAQQNDNAVYTLLAAAGLGPTAQWAQASRMRITPHSVIEFALAQFGKKYAENTRETIRRQAIHQFVQGGVLLRNPDEPGLPTHSPRTHGRLSTRSTPNFTARREADKHQAPRPATSPAQVVALGFAAFRFCRKAGAIAPRAAA